jgi:hypothetical protein
MAGRHTSILLLLLCTNLYAQLDQKIQNADLALTTGDHMNAYINYKQILTGLKPNNIHYKDVVNSYMLALFKLINDTSDRYYWQTSLQLSFEFINTLKRDSALLSDKVLRRKYSVYERIIIAYNGMKQPELAKPWQEKLYQAYFNNEIKQFWGYTLELIPCGNYVIEVSETYDTDDPKKKQKKPLPKYSFSLDQIKPKFSPWKKNYYLIKPRNSNEYMLYEVKAAKLEKGSEYLPLKKYTFKEPLDYPKIREAILELIQCE